MTFSLITATLGRVEEIRMLCNSLSKQTFRDFELYIVDQNEHYLIKNIVNEFSHLFTIHYIRNNQKGLSLNRNIALGHATGKYYGFPDDDCYYAPDTLERIYQTFLDNPKALFVASSTYDTVTKQLKHSSIKKYIYKKDVLKTCISYNFFVRRNTTLFDERLGVGTYFSSGEETDYLYSIMQSPKSYGVFCNEASVFHPQTPKGVSNEKIYKYSLGFGALQKKDWIYRHNPNALYTFLYYLLRALCGMLILKNFNRYQKSFSGKIIGFIKFKI